MANEIAKLFVTLGLNDKEFQRNIRTVTKNMNVLAKQMTVLGGAITAAVGLSVHRFANLGDEIQTMSVKTGFSARSLTELKYIAERTGTSFEAVETAIRNVANLLDESSRGSVQATETLRRLGLELKDFKDLSPEEIFWLLADALREVEDPMQRAALAQDIFGRGGLELLPIISLSKEELQALRDRYHELTGGMDEGTDKGKEMKAAFVDLNTAFDALVIAVGKAASGPLKPLIDQLTSIITALNRWAQANPEVAQFLTIMTAALGGLMAVMGPLLLLLPLIIGGFNALVGIVGSASAALAVLFVPALIVIAVTAWISAIQSLGKYWDDIWWMMKHVAVGVLNSIIDLLNKIPGVNLRGFSLGETPSAQLSERSKSVLSDLPGFASGGTVPGPLGAPVPVMAHGGEEFLGVGNRGALGATVINVNVPNEYILTENRLEDIVRRVLYQSQNRNNGLGFA